MNKDTGEVRSPCTKVCQIDRATGFCEGCGRTLEEIGNWISYSDQQKRKILKKLVMRKNKFVSE